jgi:hypothetical protein
MAATAVELPQFATIPDALHFLADLGDAEAQADYFELLGLKGTREECANCILAVFLLVTVKGLEAGDVYVNPINLLSDSWAEGATGVVVEERTGKRYKLPRSSNVLACEFDDGRYRDIDHDPLPVEYEVGDLPPRGMEF